MSVVARNNVNITGPEDGPVIVFSHGFGCDQRMWRLVAPRFAGTHRVVLFDHVGAGGSDLSAYLPQRYSTLGGYADDVLRLLRELDLRDVVFVGHSVSAMIGMLASIAEPDRFSRLVWIGPSPRYLDDDGYRGGFAAAEMDELLSSIDDNYLGWSSAVAPAIMGNPDRPELGAELTDSFCRTDPAIARHFAAVAFRSDNRADLAKVTVPTLIVQCTDDVIAPYEVGAYVHAQVPGSSFVQLAATGHCPNLSAPDETFEAVSSFLRSA